MGYRLYILSIRDLADEKVKQTAITYLDSHRLALVNKYKREQDRLRAIAAGLLLQVGFLELMPDGASVQGGTGDDVSSKMIHLEVRGALACLQDYANKRAERLPLPLSYTYGAHGKPAWESRCIDQLKPDKAYPHFNLSHSGDYAVLTISNTPIGVDIQMERDCNYPGGYKEFSRMEAFVKCTGEGIAHGKKVYEKTSNILPKFEVFEVNFLDETLYNVVVTRKREDGC